MKQPSRRAFVMVELVTLLAVVALVASLLLVLGKGSRYTAAWWDPPALGDATTSMVGRYTWTRAGILGRDFDGQEVSTSSW